jgi:ribonuclease HI
MREKGMNDNLVEDFEELKKLVESLQIDVVKNASGNKSAGVRARKGLRELKKLASELVKTSLSSDKEQ